MRQKHFQAICGTILRDLPGFASKGWILYAVPTNHILQGFCCDGSGYNPSVFTLTVFVLPLYVPVTNIHLTYGHRLSDDKGCDIWWDVDEPELASKLVSSIKREGLPYLQTASSPSQLADLVERLPGNTTPNSLETIAYSRILVEDYAAALEALSRLMEVLDLHTGWHVDIFRRATQIAEKLKTDPQAAKRVIAEWEKATQANLGF